MARVSMNLCDLCTDLTPATQEWQLRNQDGTRLLDLCDEHSKPLANLYKSGTKPQNAGTHTTVGKGPGSRLHVTTVEEIRRMKGQA